MAGGRIDLRTGSAEETQGIGEALAGLLVPGDVVSLTGDLGAGKTTLVQGAARALGVEEPVTSPSFILVKEYGGTVPVYHMDVYRLDRMQEVLDLGFEDFLDPQGVLFIEWGSVIDALLPDSSLEVELHVADGDERLLTFRGRGREWAKRWERLSEALGSWRAA